MDHQAFTNESLLMLYEVIRRALAVDDDLRAASEKPRFRIRETPDWRKLAADLEREMIRRGMIFEVIDWSSGQGELPL
jgi:hypothetical protein